MKIFLFALVACIVLFVNANIFEQDFTVLDADNQVVNLSKFRDSKVILIVNTASNCGYTYTNYKELKDMYERLHDKGLEILAFPCNQFGEQEPGSNDEIQTFTRNYGVQFPVFAKIDVNGGSAHPLYKYLKKSTDQLELAWNFVKYLVVDGVPIKKYTSKVKPSQIEKEILTYLEGENEGDNEL